MKKQKLIKLQVKKVTISTLNKIIGGADNSNRSAHCNTNSTRSDIPTDCITSIQSRTDNHDDDDDVQSDFCSN